MTAPTIKRNIVPTREPTLIDVLNLHETNMLLNLNCHHLGTIQAFNPTNQTVQVTINYKQTYLQYSGINPVTQNILVDYPTLQDVPLMILSGGGVNLTFPVKQGDQCMLFFNDRDINNWFSGSTTSANQSTRLHSFSDAIAVIGPKNLNTVLQTYDEVRALLSIGDLKIGINPSNNKLVLTNGTSLNTLLQNLSTQLENLCAKIQILTVNPGTFTNGGGSVTGVSGTPVNATDFMTISTNISNIATQIGNLIE